MVSNWWSLAFHNIFSERIKLKCPKFLGCINWVMIKIAKIRFHYNLFWLRETAEWDIVLSFYIQVLASLLKKSYEGDKQSQRFSKRHTVALLSTLQNAWSACQRCQTLLIGMLESELKQENEMKNEWLYHFAFLQFQTWTQCRKAKHSLEPRNPLNHDIGLCTSHR